MLVVLNVSADVARVKVGVSPPDGLLALSTTNMAPAKRKPSSGMTKKKTKKTVAAKTPNPRYRFPYDKEDDLIAMFRVKEYLYNQSIPDYYNKPKKERCYQAIAKRLNVTGTLFMLSCSHK